MREVATASSLGCCRCGKCDLVVCKQSTRRTARATYPPLACPSPQPHLPHSTLLPKSAFCICDVVAALFFPTAAILRNSASTRPHRRTASIRHHTSLTITDFSSRVTRCPSLARTAYHITTVTAVTFLLWYSSTLRHGVCRR